MIKLEDKSNVNPPSLDYPYGSLRNNPGDNTGTPVNKVMVDDVMQLMEKIMAESGITPNGLPDNEANGWQLFEALKIVSSPFKSYVANIYADGTNNPPVNVVGPNGIGNIVWTRTGVGLYQGVLAGAFDDSVVITICFFQQGGSGLTPVGTVKMSRQDNDTITLATYNVDGNLNDAVLGTSGLKSSLEIRTYPV